MPQKNAYPNLQPPDAGPAPYGSNTSYQHGGSGQDQGAWRGDNQPGRQNPWPAQQPPDGGDRPGSDNMPASQPPPRKEQGQAGGGQVIVEAVKLPFRVANFAFGLATKTVLGPLRGALGQQIPFSQRRHLVILPEALESFMGDMTFLKVKSTEQVLPASHKDSQLVERIGRRIVDVLPTADSNVRGYTGHLRRYKWEFATVKSDQVNAFVAPGGKVVVYTGLLDMIKRDEDKLATVLGHEASHVLARHSAEGVGLRMLLAGTGWLLCSFLRTFTSNARKSYREQQLGKALKEVESQYQKGTHNYNLAVQQVQQKHQGSELSDQQAEEMVRKLADRSTQVLLSLLVGLPNSRRCEREADLVGVRLVQRAGFNIQKAPQVWDDFAKMSGPGSEMMSVLQTHPASSHRKKALEKEVARLQGGGSASASLDDDAGGSMGAPEAKGYFAL